MARQILIPGFGYITEDGEKDILVPGFGYVHFDQAAAPPAAGGEDLTVLAQEVLIEAVQAVPVLIEEIP